jgi:hypothetical protein
MRLLARDEPGQPSVSRYRGGAGACPEHSVPLRRPSVSGTGGQDLQAVSIADSIQCVRQVSNLQDKRESDGHQRELPLQGNAIRGQPDAGERHPLHLLRAPTSRPAPPISITQKSV